MSDIHTHPHLAAGCAHHIAVRANLDRALAHRQVAASQHADLLAQHDLIIARRMAGDHQPGDMDALNALRAGLKYAAGRLADAECNVTEARWPIEQANAAWPVFANITLSKDHAA